MSVLTETMPQEKQEPKVLVLPVEDKVLISIDETTTKPLEDPFTDPIPKKDNNPFTSPRTSMLSDRSSNASNIIGRSKSQHVHRSSDKSRHMQENIHPTFGGPSGPSGRKPLLRHHSDDASKRRQPRSPHSRGHKSKPSKVVPADAIDVLDMSFGGAYHHEGPFDATLAARNRYPHRSPVAATKIGNQMALDATLNADIDNSLEMKRPLDFVAFYPPGHTERGKTLSYEEYDLNRKDGNYRRWDGIRYLDEDLKGKGTEGYLGDLAEKERKAEHRRVRSEAYATTGYGNSYELQDRSESIKPAGNTTATDLGRHGSTAGRLEGAAAKIKRRFSLSTKKNRGSP